ncbi:MAG: hypothetical protein IH845_05755 [Nanoarchaeota archaeon]|nr:hypothetical protein [Nanoarchaeota archaeon]
MVAKKEELTWKEIVERTKEHMAKHNGFDNMFGGYWKIAMMYTHRRKAQIQLYESVLHALGIYFEHKNKERISKERKR